ncbi:mevalonate kinase [Candidatus Daviesbacteria bacterium]|nr:mevalonate kinase [Candidatus Daviesbacteria bacterium]
MRSITVSAPGKLMLLGEHSVVYNRPCIVTAVGQRMFVTVEKTKDEFFELNAPDVNVRDYRRPISETGNGEIEKGAKFAELAVANFINKFPIAGGLKMKTKSEFSSQFGFGSSSASTVCVIKALSELFNKGLSDKQIFDLAYKTVLDIQGKGSGFDVAAAVFGGTLYFWTGGKIIKPLSIKHLPLIVGYSGVKADTVTLINQVKEKADKYPQVIEGIYDQIQILVDEGKKALLKKDWESLGEIMNFNQGYLASLGVSTKKLADIIYAARENGAYGAKLSGAGGGDCMICLAPEEKIKSVKKAIEDAGGKVIEIKANEEGVRVE